MILVRPSSITMRHADPKPHSAAICAFDESIVAHHLSFGGMHMPNSIQLTILWLEPLHCLFSLMLVQGGVAKNQAYDNLRNLVACALFPFARCAFRLLQSLDTYPCAQLPSNLRILRRHVYASFQ